MHVGRRVWAVLAAMIAVAVALTGSVMTAANAAYPGSDGRIAFTRANQVYTINADGTGVRQLTSSGKNYRPRYSPSGNEIAYIHETSTGSRDIWVMRADGSGKRQVTHLGLVGGASWSPNGRRLAFGGGENMSLQTVRRSSGVWGTPSPVLGFACEGSSLGQLQVRGAVAWGVGNRVAFATTNSCDSPDIGMAVADLDANQPAVQVVAGIGGACCGFGSFADPSWSPNGVRLAFGVVDQTTEAGKPLPDIVRSLIPGDPWTTIGGSGDKQPAYSPVGTRVAVTNTSGGTTRIVIFNAADSSGRRVLTTGYHPDWQPRP